MDSARIIAPHDIDRRSEKYRGVVEYMRQNGAPTIRVADTAHGFMALEGSHRLAAAAELGETVIVDVLGDEDTFAHDFQDLPSSATVGEMVEYIGVPDGPIYDVDVDIA